MKCRLRAVRLISSALLVAALALVVAGSTIGLGRSSPSSSNDFSGPTAAPASTPKPLESVFAPHTYTLPDFYEFEKPSEDLPLPAITREEIIARVADGDASLVSVDLVSVVRSMAVDPPITGRQWLVVKRDEIWRPLLGGPAPPQDSPCYAPASELPPSCLDDQQMKVRGMTMALYDAETGDLTALELIPEERCDPPAENVTPC